MAEKARRSLSIWGVPVRVQPAFLLLALILNASALERPLVLVMWLVVVVTGVLAHEMGHALAIRSFGQTPSIVLHGFGGVTAWKEDPNRPVGPWARIGISLAGPFTGIAIACLVGIFAMLAGMHPTHLFAAALGANDAHATIGELAVGYLLFVNGGWGVLNLLPIFPLDGGQVFAGFADLLAPGRGRVVALVVSIALAAGLALWSLSVQSYWTAMVGGMLALQSWTAFRTESVRSKDRAVLPLLEQARALLAKRSLPEARALAMQVMHDAKTKPVRMAATEMAAWSFAFEKNFVEAARLLESLPETETIDPVLEGLVMINMNQFDGGIARLEQAFEKAPNDGLGMMIVRAFSDTGRYEELAAFLASEKSKVIAVQNPMQAYEIARILARTGKPEEALGWLARARDGGFADRQRLDQDEDLASVRSTAGWFDFRATVPFTRQAS